jgi:hypothetical protein
MSAPTVFLLSPASLRGIRARQLTSSRAKFAAALAYRSPDGVPIGDAFTFMSALYFRGKIAYSRAFESPPPSGGGIFIIAPGFGLVPPDWRLDPERMRRLRRIAVDPSLRSYRLPLERDVRELDARIGPSGRVVLLGSIATGKYVDVLHPILGSRLVFPRLFAGIGDMSRGALMLRAAASGSELEYVTLDAPRHRKRPAQRENAR